ncbi:MAG: extracellular solute-binding protein [Planktotalea sp.]|uniref:extracellular solute-binding protein n=1 Tax=Planktotalea sp. TaxID=2029877 RepID=UPI002631E62D|nr:extracellular solute-binding protein [Planktotalea sp.]MDG1078185.1 extracellular solute-binding protein [Planktotalea sp.]
MTGKFPKSEITLKRRDLMLGMAAGGAGVAIGLPQVALAQSGSEEIIRSHGYSFFGDLQYPPDFTHFDYVNPGAPKGGEISLSTRGTFDGMNRYASKGRPGQYSGLIAEAMFSRAPFDAAVPADSITDAYCHLAEAVEYPATKEWCVFHLRTEAKFSDGRQLTAHDAAFTHNLFLEQGIRSYARSVKQRISGVEVIDDQTLKYTFVDGISRRSLISQVGGSPVFSKDWYEETGERLDEPSLLTQLGSGPYVVEDFEINRFIIYKRNPDYWGWHLPVNVGRHNFDRVRVEYFGDQTAEFEAFKAGEYTFRQETSTKQWATGYDFPGVEKGYIKREQLPNDNPPTPSGFVFNLLREPFTDLRVREALSLAYNFEWVSSSLQFGLTKQRNSFVENSALEAKGVPEGLERAFLESLGDLVPDVVMNGEAVMAHTSNGDIVSDRRNQRKALKLLKDAGWSVNDDGKFVDADGKLIEFKIMLSSSTGDTVEAIITTYVQTLNKWGISADMEKIDSAQYASRYYDKDWDMMYFRNQPFLAAGTGLKQAYGSETAVVSSYNPQSLQSPLVDAIIDGSLETTSREEEEAALRALDRVLRYLRIQIHSGYVGEHWVASYDMYEHPENLPPLALGALDFWWYNKEKHEALKASGALR